MISEHCTPLSRLRGHEVVNDDINRTLTDHLVGISSQSSHRVPHRSKIHKRRDATVHTHTRTLLQFGLHETKLILYVLPINLVKTNSII